MVGGRGSRLLWPGTGEGWLGRAVASTDGTGLVADSSSAALGSRSRDPPDARLAGRDSSDALSGVVSTQMFSLITHYIPAILRVC